jgi:hypothetical protein
MNSMTKYLFLSLTGLLLYACAPSRFVEPLDKGEWSVGADLGGPILNYNGAPIPTPLSQIEVGYGIDSSITIHGGLHLTSIFYGNAQLDLGATFKVYDQEGWKPNISVAGGFNAIYSPSTGKADFWPILDANLYWNYGRRLNYVYFGTSNYFDLSGSATTWVFSPQLGHVVKSKLDRWELITEIKWLAPFKRSEAAFVPYYGIAKQGALGFYLGVRRTIKSW